MTEPNYQYHETAFAPIKAWTKGVPVDEKALQQLRNVASLPFIHKHVAAMPDVHWGMGATIGSVIPTRGAIIPAAVGVDIGCFVGETKVPLLDGTQRTMVELAGRDEPFWVYSVNSALKVAPGRAICRKTRADAALVKVTVSGGDEIICTPDHQFMMSDGSYREAAALSFNDSLMPLYRKWYMRDGYESVNCGKGTSAQTHKMVWESLNGPIPPDHVVHHADHSQFNNAPDNLELMTTTAHSAHHRRYGHSFDNSDPDFQAARLAGIHRSKTDAKITAQRADVGTANITAYMRDRPDEFRAAVAQNGQRGAEHLIKFNTTPRECGDCGHLATNPAALRWHRQREHQHNHQVISVERLDWRADVYCLTVAEHHNFALAAGVFVHNCGLVAAQTNLTAEQLPDNLSGIRRAIEAAVPHGRTDNGGPNDRGAWGGDIHQSMHVPDVATLGMLAHRHEKLFRGAPIPYASRHVGTLGTGNHFIEVCVDESDVVWIMLHSGSRGIGNRIGTYFIQAAKRDMERWFIHLPDDNLAYVVEGSELFNDYITAVEWAQEFAAHNRREMLTAVWTAIERTLKIDVMAKKAVVDCHHNYVAKENHFGANVWLTRKGAVRARQGDLGIIPGSMGARSYIVRGKGNPHAFHSCSHGAGRIMSRGEAKKTISLDQHITATEGVECRKDQSVIDESPSAYKDIDAVMAAQADLVEIVHTLKGIVCVKG